MLYLMWCVLSPVRIALLLLWERQLLHELFFVWNSGLILSANIWSFLLYYESRRSVFTHRLLVCVFSFEISNTAPSSSLLKLFFATHAKAVRGLPMSTNLSKNTKSRFFFASLSVQHSSSVCPKLVKIWNECEQANEPAREWKMTRQASIKSSEC